MFSKSIGVVLAVTLACAAPATATPRITAFKQSIAMAAAEDEGISAFYRARAFAPIWMGTSGEAAEAAERRRLAFLRAIDAAADHGLPTDRYDPAEIRAAFASARTQAEFGALEVEMTRRLLSYARDIGSGILTPREVDRTIVVEVPEQDVLAQLTAFAGDDPDAMLQGLVPTSPNYTRLLREKIQLEEARRAGGWGPSVRGTTLARGAEGADVVLLRDRLIRMGYMRRSPRAVFDAGMEAAVQAFQTDHGLTPDGEVGPATIAALNVPLEDRLAQVVVGLERQRWMNKALEPRHILVNLAEQHAYVVDEGKVTFDTVVVIGSTESDRRTPEFSHTMTHMVINPTWNVPRSIATKEYLPALRRGGARHLRVYSRGGRVNPDTIDFSQYTAKTFPFSLKQPPGPRNALGRVKFMFPNRHNIYLHDTPARGLFSRSVRTFSHGCVRVAEPLELAYHLLAPQTEDPEGTFNTILRAGNERRVDLEQPIGVHLVYWSAWVTPTGRVNFRGDPYGRDRAVLRALRDAGVELDAERS